jgi:hypothetical protein
VVPKSIAATSSLVQVDCSAAIAIVAEIYKNEDKFVENCELFNLSQVFFLIVT